MNCHSKHDFPRQGNNRDPHFMNVRRGPAGEGVAGVKCSACEWKPGEGRDPVPMSQQDFLVAVKK
jgi:hypothetical protein